MKCCDPEVGPGGCPDENGSFDNCWDEGGFCCSDGEWYANDGGGGNNCADNQLGDSQACPASVSDAVIPDEVSNESNPIVCPDGQDPPPDTFCGRGTTRVDCASLFR